MCVNLQEPIISIILLLWPAQEKVSFSEFTSRELIICACALMYYAQAKLLNVIVFSSTPTYFPTHTCRYCIVSLWFFVLRKKSFYLTSQLSRNAKIIIADLDQVGRVRRKKNFLKLVRRLKSPNFISKSSKYLLKIHQGKVYDFFFFLN